MSESASAEQRIATTGLTLPPPPEPKGMYRTAARDGRVLHLCAHGPYAPGGGFTHRGRVGAGLTRSEGRAAAAACALAMLASARAALGSLDLVEEVLTMRGYVNAIPEFEAHADVLDGASEVMVAAFGDAGRAARTAVGVASLPFNLPIVVEASILVRDQAGQTEAGA